MNKASGGDGIPAELFQILKDDAMKVLHSICQQIWKTQQWPQDWKRSVFIPNTKKGNAKECSNYCTIALILLNRFSRVRLCATPQMAAHQAALSLGFSRQEYWSGLPFPSPEHSCMLSCFSCVWLCATLWRAALQAPLSTGFSRQEYWSRLPFPSPDWRLAVPKTIKTTLVRRLSSEELMLLNCGVGEDSWESLGLQGDPTSPFWRRSDLGFLWKEWC